LKIIPASKFSKAIFESGVSIIKSDLPIGVNSLGFISRVVFFGTTYFPFTVSKTAGDRLNIFATEGTITFVFVIVIAKKTRVFETPSMNNQSSVSTARRISTPS